MNTLVCAIALSLLESPAQQPRISPDEPRASSEMSMSPRNALADALIAYAAGDDERAIDRARLVPSDDALGARAAIVEGLALARSDSGEDAARAFARADAHAKDPELAFVARFNAGSSLHRIARERSHGDERLQLLHDAQAAYAAALELDGSDREAARQLELIRREIRAIESELSRQEQERQARRQLAEAMQNAAERQEQLADESQGAAQQQGEGSRAAAAGQIDERQRELQEQTRAAAERVEGDAESVSPMGTSPSSEGDSRRSPSEDRSNSEGSQSEESPSAASGASEGESARENLREAIEKQDAARRALSEGDLHAAERAQREAARAMRRAASMLAQEAAAGDREEGGGDADGSDADSSNASPDGQGRNPEAVDASREQLIDTLAGRILQREEELREARQRLRSRRGAPARVEKDW